MGTRGSRLALAQTEEVAHLIRSAGAAEKIEIIRVRTTGDVSSSWNPREGSFADTINRMILSGELDAGVHSAKDLPSELPEGLEIAAVPRRASRLDCIVGKASYSRLPSGSRIGTSSPRRKAQLLHLRKDLRIVELRGNVDTRLSKVLDGEIDGAVLAMAGIERLKRTADSHIFPLPLDYFVPAPGQGALALVTRKGFLERVIAGKVEHRQTRMELELERAALRRIGSGCSLPLGITAISFGSGFRMMLQLLSEDGREERRISGTVHTVPEAEELATRLIPVERAGKE